MSGGRLFFLGRAAAAAVRVRAVPDAVHVARVAAQVPRNAAQAFVRAPRVAIVFRQPPVNAAREAALIFQRNWVDAGRVRINAYSLPTLGGIIATLFRRTVRGIAQAPVAARAIVQAPRVADVIGPQRLLTNAKYVRRMGIISRRLTASFEAELQRLITPVAALTALSELRFGPRIGASLARRATGGYEGVNSVAMAVRKVETMYGWYRYACKIVSSVDPNQTMDQLRATCVGECAPHWARHPCINTVLGYFFVERFDPNALTHDDAQQVGYPAHSFLIPEGVRYKNITGEGGPCRVVIISRRGHSSLEVAAARRRRAAAQMPFEFILHAALAGAHALWHLNERHDTLHLDVKPDNLLVMTDRARPWFADGVDPAIDIVLTDCATARRFRDLRRIPWTELAHVIDGNTTYRAPELRVPAVLEGAVDASRADIYSLGLTLVQLMLGDAAVDAYVDPTQRAAPNFNLAPMRGDPVILRSFFLLVTRLISIQSAQRPSVRELVFSLHALKYGLLPGNNEPYEAWIKRVTDCGRAFIDAEIYGVVNTQAVFMAADFWREFDLNAIGIVYQNVWNLLRV